LAVSFNVAEHATPTFAIGALFGGARTGAVEADPAPSALERSL